MVVVHLQVDAPKVVQTQVVDTEEVTLAVHAHIQIAQADLAETSVDVVPSHELMLHAHALVTEVVESVGSRKCQ